MIRIGLISLILFPGIFLFGLSAFSGGKMATKVLVRVVSKDAKVIGSGVGGASVRIVNARTGETLAQGKQEGGTGDTDRIMEQPRRRGENRVRHAGRGFFPGGNPPGSADPGGNPGGSPPRVPPGNSKRFKNRHPDPREKYRGGRGHHRTGWVDREYPEPGLGGVLKKGEEVQVRAEVKML